MFIFQSVLTMERDDNRLSIRRYNGTRRWICIVQKAEACCQVL